MNGCMILDEVYQDYLLRKQVESFLRRQTQAERDMGSRLIGEAPSAYRPAENLERL